MGCESGGRRDEWERGEVARWVEHGKEMREEEQETLNVQVKDSNVKKSLNFEKKKKGRNSKN